MKIELKKQSLIVFGLGCLLAVVASGCQEEKVSAKEEAAMRQQMTDKFDINKVPAAQRPMVEAMMRQSQAGKAPTTKDAAAGAKPDAKTGK